MNVKISYIIRTSKFNEINKSIYVGSDININHRGKGFAKKIYSLLLQHLKEKYDIKIFHLEVLSHNEVGVSLYKKLGFDITNVVSDFTKRDGITIDNITMSLPIDEIKINYYDYIHNICYYVGNQRKETILKHITRLKEYNHSSSKSVLKILMVVSIMSDNEETTNKIIEYINTLDSGNIEIKILSFRNSGGTVAAMWKSWNDFLKNANIFSQYICTWEDDIIFKQEYWLDDVLGKMYSNDYDYIGMITKSSDGHNSKYWSMGYKQTNRGTWTDGGMYFTKYEKLKEFENKIGVFTKANLSEVYHKGIHGIDFGEVGFPTELYNNEFTFFGLPCYRDWEESFVDYLT